MSKRELPKWRVVRIASKGHPVSTVEAKNAADAIKKVAKEYEPDAETVKRLAAYRWS